MKTIEKPIQEYKKSFDKIAVEIDVPFLQYISEEFKLYLVSINTEYDKKVVLNYFNNCNKLDVLIKDSDLRLGYNIIFQSDYFAYVCDNSKIKNDFTKTINSFNSIVKLV